VVAVLVLGIAPVASGRDETPRWSATRVLGQVSYFAAGQGSQLVGDAEGDVALAWQSSNGLRIARARHGGPLGPARLISRHIDSEPFMAIDRRGNVIVAWSYSDHTVSIPGYMDEVACCDHVRVAMLRAGSSHVTFADLTRPLESASVRSVALAEDGSTVAVAYEAEPESAAVEERQETRLFASMGSFSRPFRHRVPIGNTTLFSLRDVVGGVALVTGEANGDDGYLHETVISAGGRRLRARQVPGSFASWRSRENPVGQDAVGDLAMLVEENVPGGIASDFATLPRRGGSLHSQLLAFEGTSGPFGAFSSPAIAVAPSGKVLASWGGYRAGSGYSLVVAAGSVTDGRLRRIAKLVAVGSELDYRDSVDAIDSAGAGVIVVDQAVSNSGFLEGEPLIAVFHSPSGRLSSSVQIGRVEGAARTAVVIDKHGRGVVAWQDGEGRLLTRRFQAP
jgi:hypothetical protein